ncbi:MAG: c-type cytochrome [Gammaproteobacteria bacterium]|nr:c-type cytochrome [Gammaproteobacteria bacterium]
MKTFKITFKFYLQLTLFIYSVLVSFSQPGFAESKGESLYLENCAICHGTDGQGGMGIPLSLDDFLKSASEDYIKKTIRLGRPNRIMPSFYWMSESDINEIVSYLDSWRKSPAPKWDSKTVKGDPLAGKLVYKNKCASCHGEDGRGGKGSGLHFSRSIGMIITPPALNNQGLLNSAPDAMLHYIINNGRKDTPMPSASTLGLSKTDINDLVSYIRSFHLKSIIHKPLYSEEPASLIQESPYSFDETVENVKRAITGSNFVHIRDQALTSGFDIETKDSPRQTIIYFCNFSFLYDALKIDPRAGMFLPCRITVTEQQDKVLMMSINPKHLSQLFNNDALDESCDQMYELYSGILEDASL